MHKANWAPSIVSTETVYLVADDYKTDRVWREVDYSETDLETVIQDLLSGQYNNPARVVAFNTAEHWSQDVSVDMAMSYGDAVTCRAEISHFSFRTSLINTKDVIGTCNYRCQCALDRGSRPPGR